MATTRLTGRAWFCAAIALISVAALVLWLHRPGPTEDDAPSGALIDPTSVASTLRGEPTGARPLPPSAIPLTSTGTGTQHVSVPHWVEQTVSLTDIADDPTNTIIAPDQGTYRLDPETAVITFTPVKGFTGVALPAPFRVSDSHDQRADSIYTATVTAAPVAPAVVTPLPRIDRSKYAKVPADPRASKGKERRTTAFNASFTGRDAYPIPSLRRPLVRGDGATLSGAGVFAFDQARLTRKGRAEVKALAAKLKSSKSIRCEGFTDYAGDRAYEIQLSLRRAKAVCNALSSYGVKAGTTPRGFGPSRPAVIGGSPKSRAENRRVVVLVLR